MPENRAPSATRAMAPVAGTNRPSRIGRMAAPTEIHTNASAKARRPAWPRGERNCSVTVIAVIASEPPIQIGVSIQYNSAETAPATRPNARRVQT